MNPLIVRNLTIGKGMPKICVPIVGTTEEEILDTAKQICNAPADLAEWRVDWYTSVFEYEKVEGILMKLREALGELPILFTFRTKAEGGEREITYDRYADLLKFVAATKYVDLIDVEAFIHEDVSTLIRDIQKQGVKVVGSNHDFVRTPSKEEMIRRLCYMQTIGADLPKIAVMPQSEQDVLALFEATREMASEHADRPIITMSMADVGKASRVTGEIFGSAITFGTLGKSSAPGQIEVERLKEILEMVHRVQKKVEKKDNLL